MSSQRGNVSRSRAQKHQNVTAFKNDKYGASVQVKKANSKIHDGLCQHCKGVLEWKVKYNKYKPLTQPRKCVRCSQKTVKDAYHVVCKPCSLQLEICCKCGKKEDIVLTVNSHVDKNEEEQKTKQKGRRKDEKDSDSEDSEDHFSDLEEEEEDFDGDSGPENTETRSVALPDVSVADIKD